MAALADRRHPGTGAGWLVAASMLLNALWLVVTQEGLLWVSVGVIIALLAVAIAAAVAAILVIASTAVIRSRTSTTARAPGRVGR